MVARWIAWRIIREILRDRRTLAFFFLVPLIVMSLIYYALQEDETARLGVVSRGVMRLFEADLMLTLEEEDIELVSLDIPDEEIDPERLEQMIWTQLRTGQAEGILFLGEQLLEERFDGKRGRIDFYLEGSRPTLTASVVESVASVMDDLASSLPVVIDSSCSAFCANSVNIKPLDLEEHYLYGSEDYRLIDFFLPVFPPFFVFFFTFLISTITFQRERVRGTLERLLIAPVSFTQIVLGYVGGFIIFSGCQGRHHFDIYSLADWLQNHAHSNWCNSFFDLSDAPDFTCTGLTCLIPCGQRVSGAAIHSARHFAADFFK